MMNHKHLKFMREAIKEARKSAQEGGIPIGAVLVNDRNIVGRGYNKRVQNKSPILHAEMDCLENAGRMKEKDYTKCVLYSTLSPCDMCMGAVLLYKIPVVVIGENESFKGAEEHARSRGVTIINLDLNECKDMMKNFIRSKPKLWKEDIGEDTDTESCLKEPLLGV
jgi:cytosine deaminase